MPAPIARLHIMQQDAHALLNPVRLELATLETRMQNYLDRLNLTEDDLNLLESARAALTVAHQEIARLSAEAMG